MDSTKTTTPPNHETLLKALLDAEAATWGAQQALIKANGIAEKLPTQTIVAECHRKMLELEMVLLGMRTTRRTLEQWMRRHAGLPEIAEPHPPPSTTERIRDAQGKVGEAVEILRGVFDDFAQDGIKDNKDVERLTVSSVEGLIDAMNATSELAATAEMVRAERRLQEEERKGKSDV